MSFLRQRRLERRRRPSGPPRQPAGRARAARRADVEPDQKPAPWHEHLQKWVAFVASLVALVLSIYNFIIQRQPPSVVLSLPAQVRIAQGDEVWLYLRPSFTATREHPRPEVIEDMELKVTTLEGPAVGQERVLVWDESGDWAYDPKSQDLTWRYLEDPKPIVVEASNPQAPTLLWVTKDWRFGPGTFALTLVATRTAGRPPLTETRCLRLGEEDIVQLAKQGQKRFSDFRLYPCETPATARRTPP